MMSRSAGDHAGSTAAREHAERLTGSAVRRPGSRPGVQPVEARRAGVVDESPPCRTFDGRIRSIHERVRSSRCRGNSGRMWQSGARNFRGAQAPCGGRGCSQPAAPRRTFTIPEDAPVIVLSDQIACDPSSLSVTGSRGGRDLGPVVDEDGHTGPPVDILDADRPRVPSELAAGIATWTVEGVEVQGGILARPADLARRRPGARLLRSPRSRPRSVSSSGETT
jgi:hypothetical protein